MRGYETIRYNNGELKIFCPTELGVKSVIIKPIKQVKDRAFQMNIMQI